MSASSLTATSNAFNHRASSQMHRVRCRTHESGVDSEFRIRRSSSSCHSVVTRSGHVAHQTNQGLTFQVAEVQPHQDIAEQRCELAGNALAAQCPPGRDWFDDKDARRRRTVLGGFHARTHSARWRIPPASNLRVPTGDLLNRTNDINHSRLSQHGAGQPIAE